MASKSKDYGPYDETFISQQPVEALSCNTQLILNSPMKRLFTSATFCLSLNPTKEALGLPLYILDIVPQFPFYICFFP